MAFNGTEGGPISLDAAASFTEAWRSAEPAAAKGVFFGKDILEQILAQEGTMGIRFYFAVNDSAQITLVAVGADAAENDQISGVIADFSRVCPPFCGNPNVLNT